MSLEMRSHAGMAKQTRGGDLRFAQVSNPSYTIGWVVGWLVFSRCAISVTAHLIVDSAHQQ
jgi:amino acid transporter